MRMRSGAGPYIVSSCFAIASVVRDSSEMFPVSFWCCRYRVYLMIASWPSEWLEMRMLRYFDLLVLGSLFSMTEFKIVVFMWGRFSYVERILWLSEERMSKCKSEGISINCQPGL